jgi:probable phosphoglycerate mutase
MQKTPELYLMRHGQSEWNRLGRHQGRLESPLTDLGRAQAVAMGQALGADLAGRGSGFVARTSPQIRAAETARIALAPLGLVAMPDARLVEVGMGDWQGATDAEIFARWPESRAQRAADPFGWNFTAPGGESFDDASARIGGFLATLTGPTVIVAHGITLLVLRGLVLGLERAAMAELPRGQGVVWHILNGVHRVVPPPAPLAGAIKCGPVRGSA